MNICRVGVVGTLMTVLTMSSVSAADLYDRDYSMKDVEYSEVTSSHRWYLRGDLGYGFSSTPEAYDELNADFVGEDLDDSWAIGGGIGYYLSRGLRMDATLDYRFDSDFYAFFPASPTLPLTGELSSLVGLVNVYYEFDMGHRITPYVGAGIGFVSHKMDAGKQINGTDPKDFDGDRETNFAWALMAGVDIDLRDRWKLDIGYRYLDLGDYSATDVTTGTKTFNVDDIESHEIRVGLRYSFNCLVRCETTHDYEPMK